jgi:hypothetical protein
VSHTQNSAAAGSRFSISFFVSFGIERPKKGSVWVAESAICYLFPRFAHRTGKQDFYNLFRKLEQNEMT